MHKLKTTLQKLLSNSWFIAIIVTFLIIFLFPRMFHKYKSELLESGFIDKAGGYEYWIDFNKDGNSERIILFNNTAGEASLKIMDQNRFILGHYYFKGRMISHHDCFGSGSIDSTGRIYFFLLTIKDDSIFLHSVDPSLPGKFLIKDKFIARIEGKNSLHDLSLGSFTHADLDNDGVSEVIFSLLAGFPLKPRQSFIYNIPQDNLKTTPDSGWYSGISEIRDVKQAGGKVILFTSYAIDNYPDSVKSPYGDHSAWLFALDQDLHYLFPPKEFPGQYVVLQPGFFFRNNRPCFVLLKNRKTRSNEYPFLSIYNLKGEPLENYKIGDTTKLRSYNFYIDHQGKDQIYLIREDGKISKLDEHLKVKKGITVEGLQTVSYIAIDFDDDGINELLFPSNPGHQPVIVRSDFSHPATLPIPIVKSVLYFDKILQKGSASKIFIQQENRYFICSYEINPWFYFRWPVYFALFLLIFLFIWMIRYIQRWSLKEKYNAEKKIAELQLLLLKNQIDPHFTFNAINSISASILQDKPMEANENILRLSRLMRSCVEHSDRLSRALAEELEFLKNYLDLIKDHKEPGFEYKIEISDSVDLNWLVPKMITQIYVENAIKHGLQPLNKGGLLWIRVKKLDQWLQIEIEDNGVGRKQTISNGSDGTGKGMKIMQQFYETFNRFNQHKIQVKVIDLADGNKHSTGTKVSITIPIGLKYSFYEK